MSCAIQACGAQLFNSGFSVTTTDSQDFRHAYAYNSTATEHYRCIQRTAHTDTILAHDALHCKDMENRSTENCIVFTTTGHARFEHARVLNNKTRNTGYNSTQVSKPFNSASVKSLHNRNYTHFYDKYTRNGRIINS